MAAAQVGNKKYYLLSFLFHVIALSLLLFGFDQASVMPVFENTQQHDVMSAVILGDTTQSKILPKLSTSQPILPVIKKEVKKAPQKVVKKSVSTQAVEKPVPVTESTENTVALNKPVNKKPVVDKKKLAEAKLLDAIKRKDMFGKDLLSDIQKQSKQQKQLAQKRLQSQFQKLLRDQSEQSLRQQLLNEEIKLQGTQTKQSQGEVDHYKALILQAISEQWRVPNQANKKLSCELLIRIAPGGTVLDVQLVKTSGDPSLDSSARAAVLKASPLPVPSDSQVFAAFRQFLLKVKPENILQAGATGPL